MKYQTKQQNEPAEAALFIDERPNKHNDFEPRERKRPEPIKRTDEELSYNFIRSFYGNGNNDLGRVVDIINNEIGAITRIIELEAELYRIKNNFFNRNK